jgi:excisionase family DNA binding protein
MSATFTLEEAARFLQLHPSTLAAKAQSGEIPGAKLGKRWVFLEVDLTEHVRSHYVSRALQGDSAEESVCHSTNAKTRPTGGSRSPTGGSAYSKALGLPTGKKPGSTTTS